MHKQRVTELGSQKNRICLKRDQDGVYNWPHNRLYWSMSSETLIPSKDLLSGGFKLNQ